LSILIVWKNAGTGEGNEKENRRAAETLLRSQKLGTAA
jgi:hypothetical protein